MADTCLQAPESLDGEVEVDVVSLSGLAAGVERLVGGLAGLETGPADDSHEDLAFALNLGQGVAAGDAVAAGKGGRLLDELAQRVLALGRVLEADGLNDGGVDDSGGGQGLESEEVAARGPVENGSEVGRGLFVILGLLESLAGLDGDPTWDGWLAATRGEENEVLEGSSYR